MTYINPNGFHAEGVIVLMPPAFFEKLREEEKNDFKISSEVKRVKEEANKIFEKYGSFEKYFKKEYEKERQEDLEKYYKYTGICIKCKRKMGYDIKNGQLICPPCSFESFKKKIDKKRIEEKNWLQQH